MALIETVKPRICVFDVDNTLKRCYSILIFSGVLYREWRFSKAEQERMGEVFAEFKRGATDYHDFAVDLVNTFGRGVKQQRQEAVMATGRRYIEEHPEEKFGFTDDLVRMVKEKGYRTIAISGSPEEIIIPFSESVGIETTFATRYEVDSNGEFTGKGLQNCAIDEAKNEIIERYIRENGVDAGASLGFGDSHHDLGFLRLVGHPFAVNPDTKLREEAERLGWPVCNEDNILDVVRKHIQY